MSRHQAHVNFGTISSWALIIWKALESYGCDSGALFQRAGLDATKLRDANARYPVSGVQRLWRLAVEVTGDPCFGLTAARFWHATTFHALGYAWLASATLHEGLERLSRYFKMVTTAGQVCLEERDDAFYVTFVLEELEPAAAKVSLDAGAATLLRMCRTSYGENFNPLRVSLRREKPDCADRMAAYFGAPIAYGADENMLAFGKAELRERLPTANADLARANDQVIAEYLARLDRSLIAMQVKVKLLEHLPSGTVTEEVVAGDLHMSLRTMQRKLRDQGTTFKALLDETRRELAGQYIENSRLSIGEITYLLGFSEPSNFSRAFKRWKGVSPSEYRLSS